MDFIIGNDDVLSDFKSIRKSGKFSHAYIIEGREGSGRLTLARAIVCTLVCENLDAPCYNCDACRKIMAGGHQDVVELIHKGTSEQIKIDVIRELIKEAYIKPAECDRKIFIIENAQQMNTASQNALLQIFEEPPKNVTFFLLTESRNLLLSTLKSRAVTLKTEKLSDETVKNEMKRRYPDLTFLDEAVVMADGALGKAIKLMEDEKAREGVTLAKRYFHTLTEYASFAELSRILFVKAKPDREEIRTLLSYFTLAIRDILLEKIGCSGKRVFFSEDGDLKILAERLSDEKLVSAYETLSDIIRDYTKINLSSALSEINSIMCDDFER